MLDETTERMRRQLAHALRRNGAQVAANAALARQIRDATARHAVLERTIAALRQKLAQRPRRRAPRRLA